MKFPRHGTQVLALRLSRIISITPEQTDRSFSKPQPHAKSAFPIRRVNRLAKAKQTLKWQRDPEGMRIRILEAAKQEFAAHGLAGARVDRIAAQAGANKRMLYYHVGNKEDLYLAVLEAAYPPALAESWDAVGLVCGDPQAPVERVHVAVDPVSTMSHR